MTYWGKLFGGVTGLWMGGPIGAVVGAALGHAADKGSLPGLGTKLNAVPSGPNVARVAANVAAMIGRKEQIYAIGMVVLSAKLAKCDSPVSRSEIDAFKRHFRIPPEQAREVGRLFDQARDGSDGPEDYARQMGRAFATETQPLEDALSALIAIARADGAINEREEAFLRKVADGFGLGARSYERLRDGAARRNVDEPDAYLVLGLKSGASDEEIRATWRQLMRDNHPDSLASRGASSATIAKSAERVARINAAWDRIKRERGL
jgi:DnaJ like chaperone protein